LRFNKEQNVSKTDPTTEQFLNLWLVKIRWNQQVNKWLFQTPLQGIGIPVGDGNETLGFGSAETIIKQDAQKINDELRRPKTMVYALLYKLNYVK
jgi:hypothetical protein